MMTGDLELGKERMDDETLYQGLQYIGYLVQCFMLVIILIIEN